MSSTILWADAEYRIVESGDDIIIERDYKDATGAQSWRKVYGYNRERNSHLFNVFASILHDPRIQQALLK